MGETTACCPGGTYLPVSYAANGDRKHTSSRERAQRLEEREGQSGPLGWQGCEIRPTRRRWSTEVVGGDAEVIGHHDEQTGDQFAWN